tara:strand:- start:4135 stop:5376 length:1242 start_codon:yes stop_codon:yes gene_type:complete
MNTTETGFLQGYFNTAMRDIWQSNSWIDVSPYGEARFAGNLLSYPNDLTKSAYWTATAVTPTANALANPADGRTTASKLLETSATSAHKVSQTYTFLPSVNYQFSGYARALGRNYLYLSVYDGVTTYTAYFNISTGVIGTTANCNQTPTIVQQNNGFWLCTIYFTSDAAAGAGTANVQISSDGSTLSYAGDATKGIYSWGNLLLQTSYASPTSLTIPWNQQGESDIDALFQIWKDSPANAGNPRRHGFELNQTGIQLVGPIGVNYGIIYSSVPTYYTPTQLPVFLWYRKQCPDYSAADYDATALYAIDDQILFEDSDGITNFWKCIVATSAGQSPDSMASSWELIEIPEVFFNYAVYAAYADWLRMDGQTDKAMSADALAQRKMDDESDKQERQQGWVAPMNVATHVTSQYRR